jgi:hypothetical protein
VRIGSLTLENARETIALSRGLAGFPSPKKGTSAGLEVEP